MEEKNVQVNFVAQLYDSGYFQNQVWSEKITLRLVLWK